MSTIAEELMAAYEPSEEDLKKVLNYDELVELCRRKRCRVDMWKWNVVDDFVQIYREQGRFKGRSQRFINKLLVKTYHRKREFFVENERGIEKKRKREWEYRKKESLLSLGLWRYEEAVKKQEMENKLQVSTTDKGMEATNTIIGYLSYKGSIEKTELPECEDIIEESVSECGVPVCNHIAVGDVVVSGTEFSYNGVGKDLLNFNTESITLENLTASNGNSQDLRANGKSRNLVLRLSQLRENTVELLPESESQTQTYEGFTQRVPQSSTQDAVS